ncbi:MAG: hypothetical protein PHO41_09340 [Eubacteriales bacterium]|nr:hypothetical protein [Eubacteriales bacterium]
MKACKAIRIKNKSLSAEVFEEMHQRLNNVEDHLYCKEKQLMSFSEKSMTMPVYSIDCGATVSQYDSFMLEIEFFLGENLKGVTIY